MTKSKIIFKGKVKVGTQWVGTHFQTEEFKDRFGKLNVGQVRCILIDTNWGQLSIPTRRDMDAFGNKKIEIIVKELI